MIKLIKDLFTERDGVSWCLGRFIGLTASIEMMVKFFEEGRADYQSFAIGVAAIIAAIAAKNFSEK